MPFAKNIQREKVLLQCWERGDTVREAAFQTNIPEGTISHYYARFNKNRDKYHRIAKSKDQTPPTSSPLSVAMAALGKNRLIEHLKTLLMAGRYGDARDLLECLLLFDEMTKRVNRVLQNQDPDKLNETFKNIIKIMKFETEIAKKVGLQ